MRKLLVVIVLALAVSALNAQQIIPIHEIQSNCDSTGASNYQGQIVTTTGIVTAVSLTHYRAFFIEEEGGGPWSGVMCFFVSDTAMVDLNVGDSVIVTGNVYEYYGNTEIQISSTQDVTIVATGCTVPGPDTLPTATFDPTITPDSVMESWEGVFVQFVNVVVTDTFDNRGRFEVNDGSGFAKVRQGNSTYNPVIGDILNIRGCMNVYYGLRCLNPRSDDDVEVLTAPHISTAYATSPTTVDVVFTKDMDAATASDPASYEITGLDVLTAQLDPDNPRLAHLTTSEQTGGELYVLRAPGVVDQSGLPIPEDDSTTFYGAFVSIYTIQSEVDTSDPSLPSLHVDRVYTVTGIVTADSTAFSWYYIQAPESGPWSGIQVYDRTNEPVMGDSIIVVARVSEYRGTTELLDVVYFNIVSSGHEIPEPVVITTGQVGEEPYEDVLVRVENATVVSVGADYFEIDDGSGICRVENVDLLSSLPDSGSVVTVTGIVRFLGSIFVRGDYDLVSVEEGDGAPPTTRPFSLLAVNTLSNGDIDLKLALNRKANISVELFDVAGRKVLSRNFELGTGVHRVGLNASVASGIYFVHVSDGNVGFMRKVAIVK